MGFQHMTKAARRRIQSKGGKASKRRARAMRRFRRKETVVVSPWKSATTAGTFGSVKRITIEGNGPDDVNKHLDAHAAFLQATTRTSGEDLMKVVIARIQQAERERIKAAILKILA